MYLKRYYKILARPELCNLFLNKGNCLYLSPLSQFSAMFFGILFAKGDLLCSDGAETCELVGIYLLHRIKGVPKNCSGGLYRDDGLIAINNATGPQSDRIRKHITEIFKSEGLKITVETNTSTTNFLDITLDLINNKFYPYKNLMTPPCISVRIYILSMKYIL